tara:strand:- start:189 stop:461 length:273 start_codon:yes stop_codon:yes gene_type:complete
MVQTRNTYRKLLKLIPSPFYLGINKAIAHNKENTMKILTRREYKTKQILNDLERKLEQMEQQDYITFDLEKDLRSLQAMLDDLREEIENE